MLAFLSWHRPATGVQRDAYEHALERFHRSLAHRPPAGFRRSVSVRTGELPWLEGGCYEDWYLLDDWSALGVLEEAAVSRGHVSAHDAIATLAGMETTAVYRLLEGGADPGLGSTAVWVTAAPGHGRPALATLLGDGIDSARDGLWRRCLALGPAPEYCLLTDEAPAGVGPARLPSGWRATVTERIALWRG